MKKKHFFILFITGFIVSELLLRWCFGFCNATLYVANPHYEYIAAPNQKGQRFGHRFQINSFSQRSEEPVSGKVKILALGDSVLYGGAQTGQDSLATTLFTNQTGVQMLNISAGSWGPDNCAAYLKEHGLFNAASIILVVSSHDAYDTMNFEPVVGKLISYPKEQHLLAWGELLNRYVLPRFFREKYNMENNVTQPIKNKSSIFNPGFLQIKKIAEQAGIPLTVYLHPIRFEIRKNHNIKESKEIIDWCRQNNVALVNGLDYNFNLNDYRDIIHLNARGQYKLASLMRQYFESTNIIAH